MSSEPTPSKNGSQHPSLSQGEGEDGVGKTRFTPSPSALPEKAASTPGRLNCRRAAEHTSNEDAVRRWSGDPRWFTADEIPMPPPEMRLPPKPREATLFDGLDEERD